MDATPSALWPCSDPYSQRHARACQSGSPPNNPAGSYQQRGLGFRVWGYLVAGIPSEGPGEPCSRDH